MAAKLTEAQLGFLDWLVDPSKTKGTQNEFARKLGVNGGTLTKWKKDPFFRDEWEKRLAELNVSPDRIQNVVDQLYRAAVSDPTGKAALSYLAYIDRYTPAKKIVVEDRAVKDLTDDELAEQLEGQIIALRRAE